MDESSPTDGEARRPGTRFLRRHADPGAGFDVVLNRLMERLSKGFHVVLVKPDTIPDTCDPTGEDAVLVVMGDACRVTHVNHGVHHGVIE